VLSLHVLELFLFQISKSSFFSVTLAISLKSHPNPPMQPPPPPAAPSPVFVFVPGAWHPPSFFDAIRARLADRGYASVACSLPSMGVAAPTTAPAVQAETESPTMPAADAADFAAVQRTIETLLAEGKDVICVAHSYGGTVATDAVGRVIAERGVEGESRGDGRVLRIVYVAAVVPLLGESQVDAIERSKTEDGPVYYRWVRESF
jgi:pimeloyl-ACP methyl ester carboxylesterase